MIYHNFHRRKILFGSVYTAFTSPETLSKLEMKWGMSIVKVYFLRGYLKKEYIMCVEGMFFMVTLNICLHNVTKHVLKLQYSHRNGF